MLLQEIFVVDDTLFYDIGTDTSHRSDATLNGLTTSFSSDGCLITNGTGSQKNYDFNYTLPSEFILEVDLIRHSGTPRLYWKNDWYLLASRYPADTIIHTKITVSNGTVTIEYEGASTPYSVSANTNTVPRIIVPSDASLTFKNLKIYSV